MHGTRRQLGNEGKIDMTIRYVAELDSYVVCNGRRPVCLPGLPLTYASRDLAAGAMRAAGR